MVSLKILLGDLKSTFFNKNRTCVWQSPEDSVGDKAGMVSGKVYWLLSSPYCPVSRAYEAIGPDITGYLARHTDFEGHNIAMDMYMIGTTPETSVPTIVICCEDTTYGKAAISAIRQSHILDLHPGVDCAYLRRPPSSDEPLQQLGLSYEEADLTMSWREKGSAFASPPPWNSRSLGPGSPIRLRLSPRDINEPLASKISTIGGSIRLGDDTLLMTAAHPLLTDLPNKNLALSGSFPELYRLGRSKWVGSLLYPDLPEIDAKWDKKRTHHELDYAFVRLSSDAEFAQDSEVLFKRQMIGDEEWPHFVHEDEFWKALSHGTICTITSSKHKLSGKASSTHSYIHTANSRAFQKVYSARFDDALAQGDSGAWVVNTDMQSVCGHIVAGHPDSGLAYFVPFYEVFSHFRSWNSNRMAKASRMFVQIDDDNPSWTRRLWQLGSSNVRECWDVSDSTRSKYSDKVNKIRQKSLRPMLPFLPDVALYNIGVDFETAKPTVLISLPGRTLRQQAKQFVRDSGILDGSGLELASGETLPKPPPIPNIVRAER
jgi:hypothetical protein